MKKEFVYLIAAIIVGIVLGFSIYQYTGSYVTIGGTLKGCKDTDKGINYNEKGEVTFENRNVSYIDICVSDHYVKEYYCFTDYKIQSKRYQCLNGCKDGACIK